MAIRSGTWMTFFPVLRSTTILACLLPMSTSYWLSLLNVSSKQDTWEDATGFQSRWFCAGYFLFLTYVCAPFFLATSLLSRTGFHNGYGMPARRLMAIACKVSSTTAPIRKTSCQGWRKIPSDTINVVAPAGGCGDFNRTITPEVSPRESPAAMTRGHVTPSDNAGPAIVKPVTTRLKYPAAAPMVWPTRVLRGDALGASGV